MPATEATAASFGTPDAAPHSCVARGERIAPGICVLGPMAIGAPVLPVHFPGKLRTMIAPEHEGLPDKGGLACGARHRLASIQPLGMSLLARCSPCCLSHLRFPLHLRTTGPFVRSSSSFLESRAARPTSSHASSRTNSPDASGNPLS